MTGDTLREQIAERTRQIADDLYADAPAWTPASLLAAGMLAVIVLALAVVGWQVANERPAAPARPTRATTPTVMPAPRSEPPVASGGTFQPPVAPVAPTVNPYTLVLPSGALAAWAPDQAAALDVSRRHYRVIESRPGATLAELDDGTRVWLVEQAAAPQPRQAPTSAPAQPAQPTPFSMFVTPTVDMFIHRPTPVPPTLAPGDVRWIPNLGAPHE